MKHVIRFALTIAAIGGVPAWAEMPETASIRLAGEMQTSAEAVGSEQVVDWFERFCLNAEASLQELRARPEKAGWSPAPFPSDYRFDKADINLAWRGTIQDKEYELLIANVSKRKRNGLMCMLRTPVTEAASRHQAAFRKAMDRAGLKTGEFRPPHIYKYRGKTIFGQAAQAELASALLVDSVRGRLPNTIYTKLSILY